MFTVNIKYKNGDEIAHSVRTEGAAKLLQQASMTKDNVESVKIIKWDK